MLPTKLNPLGVNPYDGVMEFEKAGNLYEKIQYKTSYTTITAETDEYIEVTDYVDGTINHNGRGIYLDSVYLNPDTTYSFSIDIQNIAVEDENVQAVSVAFYYPNTSYGYFCTTTQSTYGAYDKSLERRTVTGTFTTKSDLTENMPCRIIIRIDFRNESNMPLSKDVVFRVYKNTAMVVKGETIPTVYEPYNNLYRCYGESTQYQNDGRNLLPLPDDELTFSRGEGQYMTWTMKDNRIKMVGDVTQATTYSATIKLTNGYLPQFSTTSALQEYFLPAGTYTISIQNWSGYSSNNNYPYFRLVNTANKIYQVGWNTTKGVTFTTEEPIAYAYILANKVEIDCEFNIQIEAGSTMTEWKPYTTNPTPTIENPSPIISKYPKGRYKTNLEGITIKLDDDLRGLYDSKDGVYYRDYVEVDIRTKEKSVTRNVKHSLVSKIPKQSYYIYYEDVEAHLALAEDTANAWGDNGSNGHTEALCTHFPFNASRKNNVFNTNRRRIDTQLQFYLASDLLETFDSNGVKKFFKDYELQMVYALANPITILL